MVLEAQEALHLDKPHIHACARPVHWTVTHPPRKFITARSQPNRIRDSYQLHNVNQTNLGQLRADSALYNTQTSNVFGSTGYCARVGYAASWKLRHVAPTRAGNNHTIGHMCLICCCWRVSEITGKGLDPAIVPCRK